MAESSMCPICFDDINDEDGILLGCSHKYCIECVQFYVENQVMNGLADKVCCPDPSCKVNLLPREVESVVSDEVYSKYITFSINRAIETMVDHRGGEELYHCHSGCGYFIILDSATKQAFEAERYYKCPNCDDEVCFKCQKKYHEGACGLMPALSSVRMNIDMFLRPGVARCPECKIWIDKTGGCRHMTCQHCRHEFCWMCRLNWRGHSYSRCWKKKLARGAAFYGLQCPAMVVGSPVIGIYYLSTYVSDCISTSMNGYSARREARKEVEKELEVEETRTAAAEPDPWSTDLSQDEDDADPTLPAGTTTTTTTTTTRTTTTTTSSLSSSTSSSVPSSPSASPEWYSSPMLAMDHNIEVDQVDDVVVGSPTNGSEDVVAKENEETRAAANILSVLGSTGSIRFDELRGVDQNEVSRETNTYAKLALRNGFEFPNEYRLFRRPAAAVRPFRVTTEGYRDWERHYNNSDEPYWYNQRTGETTAEPPFPSAFPPAAGVPRHGSTTEAIIQSYLDFHLHQMAFDEQMSFGDGAHDYDIDAANGDDTSYMVLYDFIAQNSDELDLVAGERIVVASKTPGDGWWTGIAKSGKSGIFPHCFVEEATEETSVPAVPSVVDRDHVNNEEEVCYVVADYEADSEGSISIRKGDIVVVEEKHESGWWLGKCDVRYGYFPSTYVNLVDVQ